MSNTSQGPGWWLASDGQWYPPELWTGPPSERPVAAPAQPVPTYPVQPTYPAQPTYPVQGQYAGQYAGPYPPQGVTGAPYGYTQPVQQKTNGMAIASLICACAGLFFLPAIAGVIFGFVARAQIKRSNRAQKGNGLALAGIIVGFGWLALVVLGLALGAGHPVNNSNNGVIDPALVLGQLGHGGVFN
jgi:hypothetical protein